MQVYRIENGQGQYWTGSKWSRVGRLYTRSKRATNAAEKAKGIVTKWGLVNEAERRASAMVAICPLQPGVPDEAV